MVWGPFMRQMGDIGQTRSILGTRIRQGMAGTAERICTKFTRKTCLVLRSDEFEGQRSKVKAQLLSHPHFDNALERVRRTPYAANDVI